MSAVSDWALWSRDGRPLEEARFRLNNGWVTELWREGWLPGNQIVRQLFQRGVEAGAVSAWHVHGVTTDRLFCAFGRVLVALYDAREGSATVGTLAPARNGPA